jgi:hypothetical protein
MSNISRMRFHFYIPEYTSSSNGIHTLWEAALEFGKLSTTTISTFYHGGTLDVLPKKFERLLGKFENSDSVVAIYPDCIEGNPLGARNVARFLMAKPFILNGKSISHGPTDFVFCYSNAVSEVLPQYNLLSSELLELRKIVPKKDLKQLSIYYGKYRVGFKHDKKILDLLSYFDSFKIISRTQPTSKKELYQTISDSGLLVSFDPLSSVCYESTILGTPTLIVDTVLKDSYQNYNYQLYDFYYRIEDAILAMEKTSKVEINKELNYQLNLTDQKTQKILSEITSHFSRDCIVTNLTEEIARTDFSFYTDSWDKCLIFNCTTLKSIVRIHLLNRSIIIYTIAVILVNFKKLPAVFTSMLINFLCRLMDYFIDINTRQYVKHFIKGKRYAKEAVPLNQEPPQVDSKTNNGVISISKNKLRMLWSI